MEKLQYEKPELIVIELNEEIILASGSFCVDDDCFDHNCGNYGCNTQMEPCRDDAPVCLQPDCGFDL